VRRDRNAPNVRHDSRHTPGNGTFRQPVTHWIRGTMHDDPHIVTLGVCLGYAKVCDCGCSLCKDEQGNCICPKCVGPEDGCAIHVGAPVLP
jgi:hypothetical protein